MEWTGCIAVSSVRAGCRSSAMPALFLYAVLANVIGRAIIVSNGCQHNCRNSIRCCITGTLTRFSHGVFSCAAARATLFASSDNTGRRIADLVLPLSK